VNVPPVYPPSPTAIAFSGGGDSTALLHACRDVSTITHAFIIDHALRDGSAKEVAEAAQFARSLGYEVRTRRWQHGGITSGIQVKAREFRYAVMGEMCRAENLSFLVTGHTQDDQAETLLMRLDRQTGWRGLAGMPIIGSGQLWPALAGVSLIRPWLDVSRAEIRAYNAAHELRFVDDPSNENRDFTRVRARQALAADPDLRHDLIVQQKAARERLRAEHERLLDWMDLHAIFSPHGYIETKSVPPPELLLHILNVVSGGGGPIDAAKRKRLCAEMTRRNFKAATLSGAWVIRKKRLFGHNYVFLRDRVAVTGRKDLAKLTPQVLEKGVFSLWDGRFFCEAKTDGIHVEAAQGHLQNLRQLSEFKPLFDLPAEVRPTLPVFFHKSKPVGFGTCETDLVSANASSESRLHNLS